MTGTVGVGGHRALGALSPSGIPRNGTGTTSAQEPAEESADERCAPLQRLRRGHRPDRRRVRAVVARSRPPRRPCPERRGDPLRRPRVLPLRLLRVRPPDPQHRPSRRWWPALLELPRHAAVLPHPRRAAHRPQPPLGGHAGHLELQHRVPPHAGPHHRPGDHDGRGAPRRRLRHVHGRQVAPVPDGRGVGRRALRQLAAATRVRPVLRVPRRRDRPVHPRPHLRQPQRRTAADAGGGLPPHRGPGRQDARVHQRLGGDPPRPAVLHLPRPRRHPRAPPGTRRVPRAPPGSLRRRVGRHPRSVVRPPEGPGSHLAGRRVGAPQPGRRGLGGHARRAPSARRPSPGGLRRLPGAHRRPARPPLRRTGADGPARRHRHRPPLRQRRQPGGRALRRAPRDEVLQLRVRDPRGGHRPPRRHRWTEQPRQLPVGLGPGRQHALQVVQVQHPRGRLPRAVHRALAEGDRRPRCRPRPVPLRHRHRPDDLRAGGRRGSRHLPGRPSDPRRGHVDGPHLRRRVGPTPRAATRRSTSR